MTERPQVPPQPPAPPESTGGEITGPALLRTTKPFPLADGRMKPVGSEFHAGPVQAKKLLAQGVVEIVESYGPPQAADGTGSEDGPEAQVKGLERMRQEIAKENEAEEVVRMAEARMIREHVAELEGFVHRFLTKYTDGTVPPDDPDLDSRMFDWTEQLARGEIPDELQGRVLEDDPTKAEDLQNYALLVSRLRWNIKQALTGVLPVGSLFAQLREEAIHSEQLTVAGDEAAAKEHQRQVDLRKIEVARGYDESVPQLLEAVRLALSLLASMDPEHLIRGARQLATVRQISSAEKYARGVQAVVNNVYRPGLTEEESWNEFLLVIGQGVPDEDLDNGWYSVEEVEEGRYEFMIESVDDKYRVTVRDTETRDKRTLQRTSFYPYFRRAKEAIRQSASTR